MTRKMEDLIKVGIQGFVKIIDPETKEVLMEKSNSILYGNMSMALAYSLIGDSNANLCYIGFGNGGAYIGPTGTINYKPSLGGANSLIKNPTANLYNTVYVKKVTNQSSPSTQSTSQAFIASDNYATNYEDITIDVVIGYTEPPVGTSSSSIVQQTALDNSTFVGTSSTTSVSTTVDPGTLVFNEIGLFVGSSNLFAGDFTATTTDVENFVAQGANFSNLAGTNSKLMISHLVFHPMQKSANRSIEIIYTLRIQVGI